MARVGASRYNNVTKLRASDGALQGTFAVGSFPQSVAFDGANIWVANAGSSNVSKLPAFFEAAGSLHHYRYLKEKI